ALGHHDESRNPHAAACLPRECCRGRPALLDSHGRCGRASASVHRAQRTLRAQSRRLISETATRLDPARRRHEITSSSQPRTEPTPARVENRITNHLDEYFQAIDDKLRVALGEYYHTLPHDKREGLRDIFVHAVHDVIAMAKKGKNIHER